MTQATKEAIERVILQQQTALEVAIERGAVALQYAIARRMAELDLMVKRDDEQGT